jgi:hypothetical protein
MHCDAPLPVFYPVVMSLISRGRWEERYIMDCVEQTMVDFSFRRINLEEVSGRELLLLVLFKGKICRRL